MTVDGRFDRPFSVDLRRSCALGGGRLNPPPRSVIGLRQRRDVEASRLAQGADTQVRLCEFSDWLADSRLDRSENAAPSQPTKNPCWNRSQREPAFGFRRCIGTSLRSGPVIDAGRQRPESTPDLAPAPRQNVYAPRQWRLDSRSPS